MKVLTLKILLVITIIDCAYSWWDSDFIIISPKAIVRTENKGVRKPFLKLSRATRDMTYSLQNSKYVLGRVKADLQKLRSSYTQHFARMEQQLNECSRLKNPSSESKKPTDYDYPDPDYQYY
ncbi:uncharacterized protein LOC125234367 [Leguminivora glycinivorella]|uniref:uncharacterized protein LOC125234367 n=1 Tax=Leguminivora glycinivorella TaxID=1035111 RepID=UPI00200E5023|nr:uncharacterized protein LOC125234367 [Leguminivora glycinivorella]